ncbi:hypothetical protein F5887DRAFT_4591 [Amanita rubescens]|nr:hypothetical protein F5887DRAFT_4591 [Amanita rubescens]
MTSRRALALNLGLHPLTAIPVSTSVPMPDNTDHDSGEQLVAGPGSKEVQARNNWFSRAASFILSRCNMNDIGRDAKFENYRFRAFYQPIVFNMGAPSTSQPHIGQVPEANGLSPQLPVAIY